MYLIDTDILSALRKRKRNPEIVKWISTQPTGVPVLDPSSPEHGAVHE